MAIMTKSEGLGLIQLGKLKKLAELTKWMTNRTETVKANWKNVLFERNIHRKRDLVIDRYRKEWTTILNSLIRQMV